MRGYDSHIIMQEIGEIAKKHIYSNNTHRFRTQREIVDELLQKKQNTKFVSPPTNEAHWDKACCIFFSQVDISFFRADIDFTILNFTAKIYRE